ncbi:MAG TPA: SCO family protein [Thermoanaerobaculia bacterium]|nr:SCO family protein [Thermoanaerobaculia bacterium]
MRTYRLAALIALAGVGMLTGAAWISRNKPAPVPAASSGRGGSVWGASYFPNVPLTTHDGQKVRFFDDLIKDKVVLINFIYTSCPDTCPMETARLLEVQRILGDRVGKDVFFYSITIDPEHDTQPVLQAFAENWDIPAGWQFLTGDKDDIILLRKKLGVSIADVKSKEFKDHDLNMVLGNQSTGRWMKRSPFENSYVLANQLGSWLHNWKTATVENRDFANAPELRQISTGEDLFRTRCSSCHTIGKGDIVALHERRIGPDLYNVTAQRDRAWLVRWLAEPDKMLQEKDPLAMALLAQYKNIPMPNLQLNETDVEKLLGYMDQESRRIQKLRAAKDARAAEDHGHHGHHDAPGHPAEADAKHGEHARHPGEP